MDFRLYLITDRNLLPAGGILSAVERALSAGVKAVQLREKDMPARDLLSLANRMRELTHSHGSRLFINDRLDVALASGADGVHLGENSIPVRMAKDISGDLIIGRSTHSIEGAMSAEGEGADFVTFGPIFHTPSKADYGEPLGMEMLKEAVSKLKIPVFAIGGVKTGNLAHVMDSAKPHGVALISGIIAAADPYDESKRYLQTLRGKL